MADAAHDAARAPVPEQRRQLIAERLRAAGSVSVAGLESEFGISSMTARRDLDVLEREGRARRTHGGAVLPGLAREEDSFQSRLEQATAAKERLAAAACDLIDDGETVFFDSSSTAYFAARRLVAHGRPATVLSNGIPIMDLVARGEAGGIELIGLGGSLRRLTLSFVGPVTVRAAEAHFVDKLVFSVKGIAPNGAMTDADQLEAEVKHAMLRQARESVLLLDGSKLDRTGLTAIAPVAEVGTVLVADAAPAALKSLAAAGARLREVG